MTTVLISIFSFLFAIGVLVAVHEWGHYIVARLAGVKVLRFSIGFGKPLWLSRRGPDNTEYCVSAIPLGGYVKLLDERDGDIDPEDLPRSFNRQPVSTRVAILVAGPLMNFVFAVLAYWVMFVAGVPGIQPIVGEVTPGSIAEKAGLEEGQRIISVGDQPVETWEGGVLAILDELLNADEIRMTVRGNDGDAQEYFLDVSGRLPELTEPGRLFTGLGIQPWAPELSPVIGELTPGDPAAKAGMQEGDLILAADGEQITSWMQWVSYVRARPAERVAVEIDRNGAVQELSLFIASSVAEDGTKIGRIGAGVIVPEGFFDQYRAEQRYGPAKAISVAIDRTWSMSVLTVRMVGRMVTGDVSVKNISGPINIAQFAGYSASIGLASFLSFLGIVSLSLGILNLLPVPVLDGGQVVYQLAEWIKGRPLSERAQLIGQQIGIVFLVLVMSVAFYNDITRFFS
jgi:regulator of sigma E protease